MPKTRKPEPDEPRLTKADASRLMRRDQLPALLEQVLPARRGRGPQTTLTNVPVLLRIPPDVLQMYKATGPGWQVRMNEALRRGAKKLPLSDSSVGTKETASKEASR